MTGPRVSRRALLASTAGMLGSAGLSGSATAHGGWVNHETTVQMNVGFDDDSGRDEIYRLARQIFEEFHFNAISVELPVSALDPLRNHPQIRYVEPDITVQAIEPTSKQSIDASSQLLPWGVDRIGADTVHAADKTGAGADVAIIDTGIDADHPDLHSRLGTGAAAVTCSASDCTVPWDDDNNHGTHCAGIVNAISNNQGVVGVNTKATLHAVKVLNENGTGPVSNIAAGIQWVANQGYDVANMSFGTSQSSSLIRDACKYAHSKGVLLVAATGNSGPCSSCVHYPAAYDEVVAVSATMSSDELASFSATGSQVELAAPGVMIPSTIIDSYAAFSGTSMATPHVVGAGAVLMANGYTAADARTRLQTSAEDIGLSKTDAGFGLVNVKRALGISSDTPVTVSTSGAANITESSAMLHGSLDDLGGAKQADVRFEYGPTGGSLSKSVSVGTVSQTGSVSAKATGLKPTTEYDFRIAATASDGDTATGQTLTFHTDDANDPPTVEQFSATWTVSTGPTEITTDWEVSDPDGNLDAVTVIAITKNGKQVDSAATSVGGKRTTGTDTLHVPSGNTYYVTLTVADSAGATDSRTVTIPL